MHEHPSGIEDGGHASVSALEVVDPNTAAAVVGLGALSATALPRAAITQPSAAPALASGATAPATRVTSVEGITEYHLSNGLRVLFFPDASKPTATVNITYFVGSAKEGYGETGMAHLLEHMVFKGSTRHANIPQELTAHGARPNGTQPGKCSLLSCYEGDAMATWCPVCQGQGRVAMRLRRAGKSLDEIRVAVDAQFG